MGPGFQPLRQRRALGEHGDPGIARFAGELGPGQQQGTVDRLGESETALDREFRATALGLCLDGPVRAPGTRTREYVARELGQDLRQTPVLTPAMDRGRGVDGDERHRHSRQCAEAAAGSSQYRARQDLPVRAYGRLEIVDDHADGDREDRALRADGLGLLCAPMPPQGGAHRSRPRRRRTDRHVSWLDRGLGNTPHQHAPFADSGIVTNRGRRSAPGALSGTTGDRGAVAATRRYGSPRPGRLSCSPLLGHIAIARSA